MCVRMHLLRSQGFNLSLHRSQARLLLLQQLEDNHHVWVSWVRHRSVGKQTSETAETGDDNTVGTNLHRW